MGDNGEGKTNILEGISYLCLTKSFYAASDDVVLKIEEQYFITLGDFLAENGVEYKVRVEFDKNQSQKSVTVNKVRIDKASSLIGQFPVVILSPEQSAITFGSPLDRRKFVDFVISQSSKKYLENLINYRKILRQRNKILSEMQSTRRENYSAIESWNESLIRVGAAIMTKRIEFINDFQGMMVASYAQLAGTTEQPGITYAPSFECEKIDIDEILTVFTKEIENRFSDERRIGYSLIGPHRDEFIFCINNLNAKSYASQGQHKTFLVALKLAEFFYLKERCNETPILLLDDVLSELDGYRSQRLLEVTANYGQIFITSTDARTLNWKPVASANPRKFYIRQGKVDSGEDAVCVH